MARALLFLCCLAAAPLVEGADPVLGASGVATAHVFQRAATPVDPFISLVGTVVPATMLVTIGSGFTAGDLLDCDLTGIAGAAASYDGGTGTLTLVGATSVDDWRTLLRRVTFAATDFGSGPRTVVFSSGDQVAGANGHFYEFVPGQVDWATAKAAAASRSYLGAAGYLATLTSADESAFVTRILDTIAWIGASDDVGEVNGATGTTTFASQAAADGHWYWVTGPESGTNFSNGLVTPTAVAGQFANWATGEPNNDGGGERFAGTLSGAGVDGRWNDLPGLAGEASGYLVEYGGLAAGDVVGLSAVAVVDVVAEHVPFAVSQTVTTLEDTDIVITLTGTDADGDALSFTVSPALGAGTVFQYAAGARGAAITALRTPVSDGAQRVIFAPAANVAGPHVDNVPFSVSDGIIFDIGFITIDVTAQNDAPVWALHGAAFAGGDHQAGTAGAVEDLGAGTFHVTDVDAGTAPVQITLAVDHGSFALPVTGLDFAFTADADGTAVGAGGSGGTLCFRGTLAAVNAALDALTLTEEAGFTGAAHLTLAADDLGHSGAGGARTSIAQYRIDVAAAPPVAGSSPSHESWVKKSTGCGLGSGFAALALMAMLVFARRRW